MTSWAEPDIYGMWPINHLVSNRLQRAPNFGDRLYLTDEEFKAAQTRAEATQEKLMAAAMGQQHAELV